MASVSPTPTELPDVTVISPQRWRENYWKPRATKLLSRWKQVQVSYYGGKYSIQRLLALDEYTRNTSLLRVVLVCAGTPLPMVALVFILESIPLQNPLDGWSSNFGFWIRAVVLVSVVINGVMVEATYVLDDFHVTVYQLVLLSVCVSIGVTALTMLTASILVFPIPFFVLSTIPIFYCILMISFRLIMGVVVVRKLIASRDQVVEYIKLVGAETSPVGIFPMYEILFRAAGRAGYQLPVIMLLPLVKLMAKNIVLRYTRVKEDMVPVEVIFTVDFFNALYVSTCMQSATSLTSVIAITLADLAQTLVMLYGLRRRTGSILSPLNKPSTPTTMVTS
ncbi:hypothetical protein PR001_g3901 [Phytophthora rubi]|uniref:Uncharacterized protein n=1 Tax=Phytophthora rubi TaxID=129364 RepID=A0A6A3P3F9_9STRA|nr:hypothetical protein PR001_g3901 [Phytophthora rubi]